MISQEDMLGIIATEAVEVSPPPPNPLTVTPKMLQNDLRLVRYQDGRLEWKDE